MLLNIKTMAIPLVLSSLALHSCVVESHHHDPEDESCILSYENNNVHEVNSAVQDTKNNNLKIPNANIPQINANIIQYRNLDGQVISVGIVDKATISLYNAIQKYSSNNTSDIIDIGGFYADVEANIPKNEIGTDSYNMRRTNDIEDINRNNKKLISTQRHTQCSQLFSKLFDIFTSPKSEKGDTITVNEYTKMMDAWSSTGY